MLRDTRVKNNLSKIVSSARRQRVLAVLACVCMAACTAALAQDRARARVVDLPFASSHSDIAFSVTSGARQNVSCDENTICAASVERDAALRFALQVQRIAGSLETGAQYLYPDLLQRVPGLVDGRFDVYVVEGNEPGSASSANGRVALNSELGAWQPYDDWLAFVIAREMGHVIARHHEENSAARIATSVIMNLLIPGSGLLKFVLSTGGSGIAAISKRDVQEQEADIIAVGLLKAAGFKLRDVALALRVAPAFLDDGRWSSVFRNSSGYLLAESQTPAIVMASIPDPIN